jgi:hypothetical protein
MSSNEQSAQEVIGSEGKIESPIEGSTENTWEIEGVDIPLTPLQFHCLSLLQRLIALKNSYQTDPDFESWKMAGINKAIYSTLRDSIEANIGDAAKEILRKEHQVN